MTGWWIVLFIIIALGVAAVILLKQPGAYRGRHRAGRGNGT